MAILLTFLSGNAPFVSRTLAFFSLPLSSVDLVEFKRYYRSVFDSSKVEEFGRSSI